MVALIVAVPPMILSGFTIYMQSKTKTQVISVSTDVATVKDEFSNVKTELTDVKGGLTGVADKLGEVEHKMNSKLDELVSNAKTIGIQEGKDIEKVRSADIAVAIAEKKAE